MEKRLNEECFQKIMGDNISGGASFGRKKSNDAYVSCDFTYKLDGILYFIEIESDNKAKIDVGEYILIDTLFN